MPINKPFNQISSTSRTWKRICRSEVAFRRPSSEHPAQSTGASGPSSRMRRIPSNCSLHRGCGWNTGLGGAFGLALLPAGFLVAAPAALLLVVFVVVAFIFTVVPVPSAAVLLVRRLLTRVVGVSSMSLPPPSSLLDRAAAVVVNIGRQRPCWANGERKPVLPRLRQSIGPPLKRTQAKQGVAGQSVATSSPSTVAADGVICLAPLLAGCVSDARRREEAPRAKQSNGQQNRPRAPERPASLFEDVIRLILAFDRNGGRACSYYQWGPGTVLTSHVGCWQRLGHG